jgi:O-antigen/teichoic acid export membrane protein
MSYKKFVVKNSYILLVSSVVVTLIAYMLRIYLSQKLSIEEFGLFYGSVAVVAFFITFQGFGTSTALMKFIPEFLARKEKKKLTSTIATAMVLQLSLLAIFNIAVFLFAEPLSVFVFKTPAAAPVLQILMASLIFGQIYIIFQLTFQGFQKMRTFALIDPFRMAIILVLTIFFVNMTAVGVAYAYLAAAIITAAFFLLPFTKLFESFQIEFSKNLTSSMLIFGLPVFISTVANFVILYTDTIMLSHFTSLTEVALYQVAAPLSQFLWIFASALATIAFPMVSELNAKNRGGMIGKNLTFLANASFFAIMPFAMVLFAFPDIIINMLFGYKYIGAVDPLRILIIGAIWYTLFLLFQQSIISFGKPKVNMKIIIVISILNFALNLALIPVFGIIGAAAASSTSFIAGAIVSFLVLRKYVDVRLHYFRIIKIFFSAAVSLAVIFLIKNALVMDNQVIEAIISLLPGFIIYTILIMKTGALDKKDIEHMREIGIPVPRWFK